ncbi:cell growth-regulating nucleolar protein [Austrofundulus limnaeus]|uniref:Cell growth-regulating nucleolar protein n=1 Tax=Austrofundulus limnaeus TaxID=52670 RepID=A0A2I4D2F5_AUSLI|nr:PREDICTED: cell growth-regulating nucleolar protein [Austrofundulus limnaeus]
MVFFTCNACGESLKKAQVEKHVNMCRGCKVLSCIDCGKDFWGDDYKNHIKCISEDQKYGGKGYEAKTNKGDVKQQQWIQRVHEAMNKPGVSAKLKDVLRQVSSYDNVPRKKAKFQNWMKNSLKIANTGLHDEVWNIITADDSETETKQPANENKDPAAEHRADTNGTESQDGQPECEEKKKLNKRERKEARQQKNKKAAKGEEKAAAQEPEEDQTGKKKKKKDRKRKHGDEDAEDEEWNENGVENQTSAKQTKVEASDDLMTEETEDQAASRGKFNWKGTIKAVLREAPDQELPVKKLRKKVLAAYYSFTGERNVKTEVEVLAFFNKKINKNPKFRVLKDRVKLIQ